MSVSDFEVLTKLGEGAYSSVYKVRRLIDHAIYALKKVRLISLSTREIHNAVNEVRILASIRHPNIIGYKEAFYDTQSKSLCIVMEYADGGDLLQKIFDHKRRGQYFEEGYIWDVFVQVGKGLAKLHQLGILHRDIKSANVFLMKNGTAKLGDMNVSKVVRKEAMCETQTGTPYYASPEVWRDEPYDTKSDIWSLGCVLYEFINLKPPFRARDMEGLFKKVTRGYYSRINKNYSSELSDLLKCLIKTKPSERLPVADLLEHPLVRRHQKQKHIEIEEESILLKTIKLTKNINYLTEKLPKPNYTPLRYKSMLEKNRIKKHNKYELDLNLKLSLPPIKPKIVQSSRKIESLNHQEVYEEKRRHRRHASKERLNERSQRRIENRKQSLPQLVVKRNQSKNYIY